MPTEKRLLRNDEAVDVLEQKLNEISSIFARIVFLATRRNVAGQYVDGDLLGLVSRPLCHRLMRDAHRRLFRMWLSLDIRVKTQDLRTYFEVVHFSGSNGELELNFSALCRDILPPDALPVETSLFLGTTRAALAGIFKYRKRSSANFHSELRPSANADD